MKKMRQLSQMYLSQEKMASNLIGAKNNEEENTTIGKIKRQPAFI